MGKIIEYILYDLVRNKVILAYTLFLLLLSLGLFGLQGSTEKATLTLLNIALIAVPMMSIIFSTIHYYNSVEFMELLLAQPLTRKSIFLGELIAMSLALTLAFLLGLGLPLLLNNGASSSWWLVGGGCLVTLIFVALALLGAVITRDKAKGIGAALLMWFYFALLFDGLVLLILFNFSDYPLEKPMLILSLFNPIDLARLLVLLQMDASALLGFTGAVFQEFLGSFQGTAVALTCMVLWASIPTFLAIRIFKKKDL